MVIREMNVRLVDISNMIVMRQKIVKIEFDK
jgi:hypothetical protein